MIEVNLFLAYKLETIVAAQVVVTQLDAAAESTHALAQGLEAVAVGAVRSGGRDVEQLAHARVDVPGEGRDEQDFLEAEDGL